ncbi:unnamed protein product [Rhizophagus irregularis]|nr:unnamed protein product [Rhizophagus irregularis]
MNKHLHQHPLIPDISQQNLTSDIIRKQAVLEMYTFCKKNSLVRVWSYMWREWYSKDRWVLWARSAFNTLSILKITMFVEGHWKVLKRDFLYKFFCPQLDLLVYILLEKLIPHQQRKFEQQLSGREMLDWRKSIKRNNQLPFLILDKTCDMYELNMRIHTDSEGNDHTHTDNEGNDHTHTDNEGNDRTHTVSGGNDIHTSNQETNNTNESDIFENLIDITQQTLDLLEKQKRSRNILWVQGVKRNFNQIKTMILEHFLNELSGFY